MGEKWEKVLSKAIGVNGIHINSSLVSAQNRKRIYWTNIGMQPGGLFGDLVSIIQKPKDKGILLKDVLENKVDDKYFLSDKAINSIINNDKNLQKSNVNPVKSNPLQSPGHSCGIYKGASFVVHNTMPRSGDPKKGGTGHLSRTDGKTYCLDTGNTNAVEIVAMRGRGEKGNIEQKLEFNGIQKSNSLTTVQKDNLVIGGDYRYDEGFRWRDNNKSGTLPARGRSEGNDFSGQALAKINNRIRRLTPLECERLQTVKDNYTNHVSDSQRYKMLGNGWTVDVIAHIFSYLK
jgi:DNA (cytosine-5)-methyltransferase 3A